MLIAQHLFLSSEAKEALSSVSSFSSSDTSFKILRNTSSGVFTLARAILYNLFAILVRLIKENYV